MERDWADGWSVMSPISLEENALKLVALLTTPHHHQQTPPPPPPPSQYAAGSNSSAHSGAGVNARKLEESEETKHASSGAALGKAIMQARMAKKWTQKQLATAINEKPQVVGQYEQGKAIPNPQIISKLERQLNCRLPRPGKKPKAAGAKQVRGGAKRRANNAISSNERCEERSDDLVLHSPIINNIWLVASLIADCQSGPAEEGTEPDQGRPRQEALDDGA